MSEHITSIKTYSLVFAALMLLLVATIFAGRLPLGRWDLPVAMAIAVAKTLLIAIFFMHLASSAHLVRLVAGAALLWLVFLAALTFSDYATRDWSTDAWRTYHPTATDRAGEP